MEHLPQRAIQIGRILSLLCIYVIYSVAAEVIQQNRWPVHIFLAANSFFFASSVFICVTSTLANESWSLKATAQFLVGRILRIIPAFLLCLLCYDYFVPDNVLALAQELYLQLWNVFDSGFPTTLATPLSPVYMVVWLVFMDTLLHLTLILIGPLICFVARVLRSDARITHTRWVPYLSGFTFWTIWLLTLYNPLRQAVQVEGFATVHTIGRIVYHLSVRCFEWLFFVLAACLSYTSLRHTRISSADAWLNRTSCTTFFILSFITLFFFAIYEYSLAGLRSHCSSTVVVAPAACAIFHFLLRSALLHSKDTLPQAAPGLPSFPSNMSTNSDSSGSFSIPTKSAVATGLPHIVCAPVVSLLVQCSHELLCMYPLSWIIAYTLNPEKSNVYHILFALPLMVSAAIVLRAFISNPACWLVRSNSDCIDLNVPASSLFMSDTTVSPVPSMGQYVAVNLVDEKSND